MREFGSLRYEPIEKRIRGEIGGEVIIDSRRALLVWEPMRIVPSYAIHIEDVAADVVADAATPGGASGDTGSPALPKLGDLTILDPSVPFAKHSADGESTVLRTRDGGRTAASFRPSDPALADYLIVDFDEIDAWYEEDERNFAHPRDPFHRIDILHSSRHVEVHVDGAVIADTSAPYLLFETGLPVRFYLPAGDVRTDLFEPSATATWCAYKGEASYWSMSGSADLAWTYRHPLREAAEITDRIAFFNERVDLVVDGEQLTRPITPWSPRPA
jgi:uncharacterized protein (DUF427 family)